MDIGTEEEGQDGHEDRILLPTMSGATYHNRQEKQSMRWTFEIAIGARRDNSLNGMIQRLRGEFEVTGRCSQLNIKKFKVSLSVKNRFEIDSEEQ